MVKADGYGLGALKVGPRLAAIGIDLDQHDLRFVEDNWDVITSYSIHYTKLYENLHQIRSVCRRPHHHSIDHGQWRSRSPSGLAAAPPVTTMRSFLAS